MVSVCCGADCLQLVFLPCSCWEAWAFALAVLALILAVAVLTGAWAWRARHGGQLASCDGRQPRPFGRRSLQADAPCSERLAGALLRERCALRLLTLERAEGPGDLELQRLEDLEEGRAQAPLHT